MTKPTFIIDFDSTIIRSESLEELAALTLRNRKDRDAILTALNKITVAGMAGELSFDASLRKRLQLFTADHSHLAALVEKLRQDFTPSVLHHREWFMENKDHIYVVSGGFEEFIVPVVAELGIKSDHVLANVFEISEGGMVTGFDETRHLGKAKGKVRQVAALKLPRPIIVIGDGFTDYEIRAAGEADAFWAFCENVDRPSVTKHADRVLMSFDDVVEEAYAVQ